MPSLGSVEELNNGEQVKWNRTTDSVSWYRVLHLSRAEWPILVIGVIAAAMQGAIFPSFSIFFGQAIRTFTYPFDEVSHTLSWWCWDSLPSSLTGTGPHSQMGGAIFSPWLCLSSCHSIQTCCISIGWRETNVSTAI